MAKKAQEKARERAKKRKQGGGIVQVTMSLCKCDTFKIIINDKDVEEEMSQLFIVV